MHNFIESWICMWKERIKWKDWKTLHPTQKPVEILKHIIEIASDEWDIVLDPFMWVGSTWEACKQLNRQFIWIEMDSTYFKAAEKRLLWNKNNISEKIILIRNFTINSLSDLKLELLIN